MVLLPPRSDFKSGMPFIPCYRRCRLATRCSCWGTLIRPFPSMFELDSRWLSGITAFLLMQSA